MFSCSNLHLSPKQGPCPYCSEQAQWPKRWIDALLNDVDPSVLHECQDIYISEFQGSLHLMELYESGTAASLTNWRISDLYLR